MNRTRTLIAAGLFLLAANAANAQEPDIIVQPGDSLRVLIVPGIGGRDTLPPYQDTLPAFQDTLPPVQDTVPYEVCPEGWTCTPPDTLVYVPHVTPYRAGVNPDSAIQRYAQAPVGDGSIFYADSGRVQIDVWIRVERRDGAWELAYGPLPNDTTEASGAQSVRIAAVDSVKFWIDGVYANREGAWPYEAFPSGVHLPIPLLIGSHTIRYRVWGTEPEDRTLTVIVRE